MELTEWKEKALDTIKGELTPNNRNNGSGNGSKSGNNHTAILQKKVCKTDESVI